MLSEVDILCIVVLFKKRLAGISQVRCGVHMSFLPAHGISPKVSDSFEILARKIKVCSRAQAFHELKILQRKHIFLKVLM